MKLQIFLLLVLSILVTSLAQAQLKTQGPYQAETGEYRFPSQVNEDVMPDRETEIWARVFWAKDKTSGEVPANMPIVVLLHGNHATCGRGENPRHDDDTSYTRSGSCPFGYKVTPNHEGYNYFAEELASYGYVVVSINANRGITAGYGVPGDGGLNLVRGHLVLKHLALWKQWATQGGQPESLNAGVNAFLNKINFSQVGLFGHSRGGEGVRAAYNLYNDTGSKWPARIPDLKIKAIFEVGAVDGQTDRTLDANGVIWNQLIPVCDGDVSDYQGVRPFNRMINGQLAAGGSQKSVYYVYGANHNFFNTEWQESDSYGCENHKALWDSSKDDWKSEKQQEVGTKAIVPFFRANVGSDQNFLFNQLFNPLYKVFEDVTNITRIERDYIASQSLDAQIKFDDFRFSASPTVTRTHSANVKTELKTTQQTPYIVVMWSNVGTKNVVSLTKDQPVDASKAKSLDFRFSLLPGYQGPRVNFKMILVDVNGQKSTAVALADHSQKGFNPFSGIMFETVRMPMRKFKNADLTQIKTVEIVLEDTVSTRTMYLANLRFSLLRNYKEASAVPVLDPERVVEARPVNNFMRVSSHVLAEEPQQRATQKFSAQVVKTKAANSNSGKSFGALHSHFELTLTSDQKFKVRDAMPVLKVGTKTFNQSVIRSVNGQAQISFLIPRKDEAFVKAYKKPVKVYYQGNSKQEWIIESL